jgi:TPR repeat protein
MVFPRYVLCLLLLFYCHITLSSSERWNENFTYTEIIKRAQAGSAYFQGLLGIYLRSGEAGSSVDLNLSRKWSKVAESKGHPFGSYNLANIAMSEGDFVQATTLYQDAALKLQRYASDGDPVAMYCMGEIDFQVIPTNVHRALDLFKRSAESGYPQAQATIGALYLRGLPGLLKQNPEKGIELLSAAVKAKSLTARFNLGMAYYNGDGVEKNIYKASQWLQLAVKQNFSEAQCQLGLLFLEGGDGVPKNTSEGIRLLRTAAAQNHQWASDFLKKRGNGEIDNFSKIPKNTVREIKSDNFKTNDRDIINKARKLYTGVGVEQNYAKAFELFYPLAQGGNPEAARFVGLMYLSGKGKSKDLKLAKQWLSVAAQKGDKSSIKLLDSYRSLFK